MSKLRNDVLIEAPGKLRRRRLTVLNTRSEHDRFVNLLRETGFETTGNYHRPFAFRLLDAGFTLRLVSSVALARTREALHDGWNRNDPEDAQASIAEAPALMRQGSQTSKKRRIIRSPRLVTHQSALDIPAEIRRCNARLVLAQDGDDLLVRNPLTLHLPFPL